MGRGKEYVKRKHKRAERKRNRSDSDGGVAELAAAKKRRRKGKRRITEGMCYSLPTAENPFLDEKERAFRMTHGKKVNPEAPKAKRAKTTPNDDVSAAEKKPELKPTKLKKVFWPKGDAGKPPIASVLDPRLSEVFCSAAKSLAVEEPTAFQGGVWRAALQGQGVWGFVNGAVEVGALAGYLLPAVQHVKAQEGGKMGQGPAALVLVPSKARGAQVLRACRKIRAGGIPLKAVNIHEEADPQEQLEGLESQVVDLVAATPGRLSKLNILKGDLLSRVTFAVIDSADQMSERDLRQAGLLAESLRADAQTLFFTGSYSAAVHDTQSKWLKDPIQRVATTATTVALCAGIEQRFVYCSIDKKAQKVVKAVLDVRESEQDARVKSRILVLAATATAVESIVAALAESGLKAGARHGDLRTEERLSAEDDFRAGKVPILVTTSISSPGLHASSVPVLIIYDLPGPVDDYVSLVGHVARTTAKGRVHSLFTTEHAHLAVGLSDLLQACAQPVDPKLEMMARAVKQVQQQQNGTGTGTKSETRTKMGRGIGSKGGADGSRADIGTGNQNGDGKESGKANGVANGRGKGERGAMAQTGRAASRQTNGTVERLDAKNGRTNGGSGRSVNGSGQSDGRKRQRNVEGEESDGGGNSYVGPNGDEEDDEATLEEEEQLAAVEGAPGGADELAMLEEENSMSIEQLLEKIRVHAAMDGDKEKVGSKRKKKVAKALKKDRGTLAKAIED